MKSTPLLTGLLLSLFSIPCFASPGDKGGNGGGGWVCTQPDGSIKVELFDFKELELKNPTFEIIPRSDRPRAEQLEEALKRFAAFAPERVAQMRDVLEKLNRKGGREEILPTETLPPPNDIDLRTLPYEEGCDLKGVADFDDERYVLRTNPRLTKRMSETDLAALDFHEAYYKTYRDGPAQAHQSRQARGITAGAFSSILMPMTPPEYGIGDANYECDGDGKYHFYVVPLPSGVVRLQFTRIAGVKLIDKTTVDLLTPGTNDGETIGARALEGFAAKRFPRSESNKSEHWQRKAFTESEFEPPFAIKISLQDIADTSTYEAGSVPPSITYSPHGSQPWLYRNQDVEMDITRDGFFNPFNGTAVVLKCRRIR